MDLKALLGGPCISMRKEELARVIGPSPGMYHEVVSLATSGEMPACWRAAWMMDYLSELHPALPLKYIDRLWSMLTTDQPDGVRRSTLRMLARYDIPGKWEGMAADLCMKWLTSPSQPVGVKVFCMEIMRKITLSYPDLRDELVTVLEDQIPNNSGGFGARAHHIIKSLEKL